MTRMTWNIGWATIGASMAGLTLLSRHEGMLHLSNKGFVICLVIIALLAMSNQPEFDDLFK